MIIRGDEPIYIHRRTQTGTNSHGNPTFTWTSTLVRDALFSVTATSEPTDVNRDAVDASVTLYLSPGTVIQDGDEFEIRGKRWVKDGDAQEWSQLWPDFAGVVVQVRRRRG